MHKLTRFIIAVLLLPLPFPALAQAPGGHAHNDYEHARPLLDALEQGFSSVEADIWLRGGQLMIGHDEADLDPSRTLQNLYLDPLRTQVAAHGGVVLGGPAPLTLLIDIKTEGETSYRALSQVLSGYADILSRVEGGKVIPGAVTAIVSGNRPKATMLAENPRYAFYDGRLADLDGGLAATFMPLVSDNWIKSFTWSGAGTMPLPEHKKLADIVAEAHAKSYQLRFWETPDAPGAERDALWQTLAEAGVDYINTDDLAGFAAFRDATPLQAH